MTVLQVEHVTKTYRGGVLANDDISLDVAAGEVFGLLGPNGAGKTTLVNQVLSLLVPDSGRITVDGRGRRTTTGRSAAAVQLPAAGGSAGRWLVGPPGGGAHRIHPR